MLFIMLCVHTISLYFVTVVKPQNEDLMSSIYVSASLMVHIQRMYYTFLKLSLLIVRHVYVCA